MVMQRRRKKLGEILIAQGMITHEQLLMALQEHKRTGVSVGKILVGNGFITDEELSAVLGEQIQLTQRKRIGEVLIEQGLITEEQLNKGLEEQRRTGLRLGKCLTQLKYLTENKLVDVLSAQLDVQHVVIENLTLSKNVLKTIPEEIARKYKVIPLFEQDGILTVAMADPSNLRTLDHLKFKTGKEIEPVIATEKGIVGAIDKHYSSGLEEMTQLLGDVKEAGELDLVKVEEGTESLSDEEGAQVVKLVNLLVNQAISERASDIHLEPMEGYLRLRYRIDGVLIEKNPIPLQLRAQIISRLKIMAGMDIAEKRKPQDGRFQIRHDGREIDLRVSTFPAMTRKRGVNEKVVMRILDPESLGITIDKLGFLPHVQKRFLEILKKPDGILLVTGPTGSGKTSTLYASLQHIYDTTKNIVTMEDPVELHFDGINQGQINSRAGFTFAEGMRSILRQDPDIILIGEMRDSETCEMAIQAALTGHLVLSTLHTNDAPSTYTRLLDMGLEPFLVTSTIIGVVAQRLVRKICSKCKEVYQPDPELLAQLGLKADTQFYRGKGCNLCEGSGYRGRLGLYELLIPDATMGKMVVQRSSSEEIRKYLLGRGDYDTLRRDGLRKAIQGITTIEQVLGATQNE
ncbi:Type IV fimbrial assembly, ATPase PilB [Chitinispirillum alkaliphilum]|nr:Type IV fimbrial assembly, ATPase PilB [Chitinispirillum alkaliphilum]